LAAEMTMEGGKRRQYQRRRPVIDRRLFAHSNYMKIMTCCQFMA
jgi:hypothetical protein